MSDVNDTNDQPVVEESVETPEAPTAPSTDDRFRNLQAEMNRKLENQNAQLLAILESVQKSSQVVQAPVAPQKAMKDLMFDDPEAYTQHIIAQAASIADQKINEKVRVSSASQSVVNEISGKYAEFSNPNSEAAQEALAEYAKLPQYLQNTPEGTRLALMNVVANRGLSPTAKRQASKTDDFALGGGAPPAARRSQASPKSEIDPQTLAFAELIGIDVNDPKRLEGLKKSAGRKNWNRYE